MSIDVITFGCRLNGVESDAMRAHAVAAGHRDLTIVNTCAVTAEATRQARQTIRRVRRERPGTRLVVTGCAAETEGALFRSMPEVNALVPNRTKSDRATWHRDDPAPPDRPALPPPPQHTRGFVEVQNGCDHRCTFCIIPFGRGASRSIPVAQVLTRIRELLDTGVREIVLSGVDVTAYGTDLEGTPTLGALVRRILRDVPDLPRLRLSSLDCVEADPLLLEVLAGEPRLMPHLHLSLQSGSDLILKRMKRRHLRDDALRLCADVRALRPDIAFGADFIVGFPTETEAMFAETLSLIEGCGISYIHAFPYSARPGTPAARMPAVPGAIVKDRAARVRELAQQRLARHLDGKIGHRVDVLTERGGKARAADFSVVRLDGAVAPGRILPVTLTGQDGRELHGTLAPGFAPSPPNP